MDICVISAVDGGMYGVFYPGPNNVRGHVHASIVRLIYDIASLMIDCINGKSMIRSSSWPFLEML